jgi:hypothetical protein
MRQKDLCSVPFTAKAKVGFYRYSTDILLELRLQLGLCFTLRFINSVRGFIKRCRLSWLTNSALVYESKCGGGGDAGSQAMSTAVYMNPK